MKPPPGQTTTAVPFFNSGAGLKTVRGGNGDVCDHVGVPDLGEERLLRIVRGLGARRKAWVERNDILRGCGGGKKKDKAEESNDGGFHGGTSLSKVCEGRDAENTRTVNSVRTASETKDKQRS
jgi:hypothetical protein